MRKTLLNVAIAAVILAGGCAYQQLKGQTGPTRVALPQPDTPPKLISNVKLNPGRRVQSALGMLGRAKPVFNRLVNDHEGQGASEDASSTTVGALKAKGLFKAAVLSDDSVVMFLDARGGFVQRQVINGRSWTTNYTRLVAMFDPADGSMLAYGLVP